MYFIFTIHFGAAVFTYQQDAQLSQRDRATGCVIVLAKSGRLELGDNIYGHYRPIFNHCDIIGLQICRIP